MGVVKLSFCKFSNLKPWLKIAALGEGGDKLLLCKCDDQPDSGNFFIPRRRGKLSLYKSEVQPESGNYPFLG